jgi:LuxR family maltose regulon positive regulatory protein
MLATPLASKLVPPRIPGRLVARPRLYAQLSRAVETPVTLLAAPAGSGKTVLLASWVAGDQAPGPVAWASLGPEDGSPRSWWSTVVGALVHGGAIGRAVRPSASANGVADVDFVARLDDALRATSKQAVLVLDDVHEVADPRALGELDLLLRHQPDTLRLILSTRADPAVRLQRLRLAGQLAEIRAADLAFTPEETVQLLAGHELLLGGRDVGILHARTEGWAAGLRLAALSMAGSEDPASRVAELAADDRAVADYLLTEVFERQPFDVREFMLRTCLPQRLEPGLAAALTGLPDAAARLDALESANLFLSGIGHQRHHFRYHPLFAGMLRRELRRRLPDETPELHRRAAHWYAEHGELAAAVAHAIEAREQTLARDLVVAAGFDLASAGDAAQVERLLGLFAADALEADPELALVATLGRLLDGDLPGVDRLLGVARSQEGRVPPANRAIFVVRRAAIELFRARAVGGEIKRAVTRARRELGSTDLSGLMGSDALVAELAWAELGACETWLGDLDAAATHLESAVDAVRRWPAGFALVNCLSQLATLRTVAFRPADARVVADEALARAEQLGLMKAPAARGAHFALAWSHYHADELESAEAHVDIAQRMVHASRPVAVDLSLAVLRSRLLAARGDVANARQLIDDVPVDASVGLPTPVVEMLALARVRLLLADREIAVADSFVEDQIDGQASPAQRGLLRGMVRLAGGDPMAAASAVTPALARTAPYRYPYTALCAWVVTALAADALGNREACDHALERALALARPQGFRRVFADHGPAALALLRRRCLHLSSGQAYARSLLGDHDGVSAAAPAGSVVLSSRELEVLARLPSELSYGDIAARLYVSVNTVKTHVKNIYRKFGVNTRHEAVERARAEGLL